MTLLLNLDLHSSFTMLCFSRLPMMGLWLQYLGELTRELP